MLARITVTTALVHSFDAINHGEFAQPGAVA
jgi:hypothetical protein